MEIHGQLPLAPTGGELRFMAICIKEININYHKLPVNYRE